VTTLPLIADYHPSAVLAWRADGPVTQGEFAVAALSLSRQLAQGAYAINLCEDRYLFMLALSAVCLCGQTNLLPASSAPAAIDSLLRDYPGSYIIGDADVATAASAGAIPARSPRIPADHVAAIAFTSGSTGAPQAHAKSWRVLTRTARLARKVFLPEAGTLNIVATVPAQHMYGLETSVFFALAAGCASHHGKPFFPADVRATLAEMPAPRVLISTPVHLRALVAAGVALPELRLIISATAPLSTALAQQAEQALGAQVMEIYGCTEAGSMASRRTCETAQWQLHPRMRITADHDGIHISGGHLPDDIPVHDSVEIVSARRFGLLGRSVDMLKVAGKRASLADLTQRLLAVPGVEDGVLFLPDGAERPAALVVAPQLAEGEILAALAPQFDAVFLPRPLRKVARLPRNELGKLPHARLMELLASE
jgi:acyl-coenzyme A synthetase/AMP-(fatty) acid ligase